MIFLISGKQGSGKTTLANSLEFHLERDFKMEVVHTRFAKAIYEMHDECRFILSSYGIEISKDKDGDLLQYLGTEWGRNRYGKDIWCKTTKAFVNSYEENGDMYAILISDCRFKNELETFPDAIKIRLVCDRDVRKRRCESWRDNENHPSEIDLDGMEEKFDIILDTGTTPVPECTKRILKLFKERLNVKKASSK